VFRSRLKKPPAEDPLSAIKLWAQVFGNPLTWDDLPWLRSLTKLPLILKGIMHPDDARRAIDGGVDGIYCSNHGGRQANGGLPALDCLAGVVDASGETPVLFDSGVRSGADVVKPSRSAPLQSGWAAPTRGALPSAAMTAWCTSSGRSSPRPI
jgi:lactate 2-monooxygenase